MIMLLIAVNEQFTPNFSLERVLSPYIREKSVANSSLAAWDGGTS